MGPRTTRAVASQGRAQAPYVVGVTRGAQQIHSTTKRWSLKQKVAAVCKACTWSVVPDAVVTLDAAGRMGEHAPKRTGDSEDMGEHAKEFDAFVRTKHVNVAWHSVVFEKRSATLFCKK